MVAVGVFKFSAMRCQPLRRALGALEKIMKKWLLIMLASFSSVVSAENESLDCKKYGFRFSSSGTNKIS